mgnify:FL=1
MLDCFILRTNIIAINESVRKAVNVILPIARDTLKRDGSHFPTAVLHTMNGAIPVLMTFQDIAQRKKQVEHVKSMALEENAYAVSAITCAKVVDCRSSLTEEALVIATTIRGSIPYVVTQSFIRDANGNVAYFHDTVEGDEAFMIGQMMIFPDLDSNN